MSTSEFVPFQLVARVRWKIYVPQDTYVHALEFCKACRYHSNPKAYASNLRPTVFDAPRVFVKSEAQLEGGLTATSEMDYDSVSGKVQRTFWSGTIWRPLHRSEIVLGLGMRSDYTRLTWSLVAPPMRLVRF